MRKKNKLIYGVGINDADYVVCPKINGKQEWCPFYRTWLGMLERCYDKNFQTKHLTYVGCTVCNDWLVFSKFRSWMVTQDWQAKDLDKDILSPCGKVYSPATCVFIDHTTNKFTTDCGAARGKFPIGVYFNKIAGKFQARCRNPFTKKQEHLGYFSCQNEAHKAWQQRKHEYACKLADIQSDERVAFVLRNKYTPDKDWTNK